MFLELMSPEVHVICFINNMLFNPDSRPVNLILIETHLEIILSIGILNLIVNNREQIVKRPSQQHFLEK